MRSPEAQKRIIVLPLAASNQTEYLTFRRSFAPACGSILPSAKNPDIFWCAKDANNTVKVPAVRIERLLELLPKEYSFTFMKIDAEGADLMVAQGAGKFLEKFQ